MMMMHHPSCTAIACMVLVTGTQGFVGSGFLPAGTAGLRNAAAAAESTTAATASLSSSSLSQQPIVRCSASPSSSPSSSNHNKCLSMTMPGGEESSRGDFVKSVVGCGALGLATAFSTPLSKPAAAAAQSLEELEADLIICKEVFKPTLQYLKAEQFDAARTNTNYITRFFNLKKKIDALIVQANDVVDDTDKMERAFDMAQEVEALFTNFDASVYTIIFIPADADGVLPPGAEKYLKQAYGFYDDINKVLDFYIGLVPAETRAGAEKLLPAKRESLPKFLFKEKSSLMREKVAIS